MTIEVSAKSKKTKFKSRVLGCMSLLPLFAFAPTASANLITNGSFETLNTPLAKNGICTTDPAVYPYGACSATGWTGNYQIGDGATIGRAGVSFGVPQPDPDGVNALIVQSVNSLVFPSATQSIDIPTTGDYTLTFYAANRTGPAGNNGPQTLSVLWNNAALSGGTYSRLGGAWTLETLTFSAEAGTDTLTFAGLDPSSGDVSAFVDDVSLLPASSDMISPEPSSFALVAFIGLSAAAGLARKRLIK